MEIIYGLCLALSKVQSLDQIFETVPVWRKEHAEQILEIIRHVVSHPENIYVQFVKCNRLHIRTLGLPHYSLFLVYFVANNKPHVSHFWANRVQKRWCPLAPG